MRDKRCLWCHRPLPPKKQKYCSDECGWQYWVHNIQPLWWQNARHIALERAGGRCEECGSTDRLEVHHIVPLAPWEKRHNSPKNAQDNLRVLCRACHELAHHPPAPAPAGASLFEWAETVKGEVHYGR